MFDTQQAEALLAHAVQQERVYGEQLTIARHEIARIENYIRENGPRLDQMRKDMEDLRVINGIFRGLIEATTTANLRRIEELANMALRDIFVDRRVEFSFTTETKRDLSTIIIHIKSNGADGTTGTHGGGLLAPIALVLRVLTNLFAGHLPLIALDESLVHVSEQYIEPTCNFLRQLTEELGVVVLLVTHQVAFSQGAHKNIKIDQDELNQTRLIAQ